MKHPQMRVVVSTWAPHRQAGVALVGVLIFMLALAGIAIVSARSALLGEAVSRNQLDSQVARQAAEAALRDGEKDLLLAAGSTSPNALCSRSDERPAIDGAAYFDPNCTRGQCDLRVEPLVNKSYSTASASNQSVAEAWWPTAKGGRWNDVLNSKPSVGSIGTCTTFTGGVPLGTFTGSARIEAVAQQPEYLIERFTRGDQSVYRITSRGFGYRTGTQVVMQSYFLLPQL